ncbi:MAG TPA: arginine--tRNA ligase [Vicinamibacterales bacterium]|nr:arginine--tRNA ligase [Vicinamibacterales bacterium]
MILPIHQLVRARIIDTVGRLYSIDAADPVLAEIPVELAPNRGLGDLAVPLAFTLARRLRKAPRVIAQEVAAGLGTVEGFSRIEPAATGYINFFLDRSQLAARWLRDPSVPPVAGPTKAIVEHTAINPNKAAHIGHLRNAALGDAFGRLLRFLGQEVEIQNYIDDTGVQVADVAVGFRELEHQSLDDVRRIADTTRFDYHCWDLYARVTEWYEGDKARLAIRTAALHDIEHGGNATADMARFIADRVVRCHLRTMARMNIGYDLLTWEGDILRLQFWAHAFAYLKQTGAVFLQTEGKLKGCWVMTIEDDAPATETEAGSDEEPREKVIVRSDGTVTYVGKDMAYQLWKFGLLGKDFRYRIFEDGDQPLWSTTSNAGDASANPPPFGRASWVCNVIDTRQSYLQKLLKQALVALNYREQAAHSIHYSYEMVALSHATARELGYDTSAVADRPFVEVSGRKGLGVKADDLLDRLRDKAAVEVAKRNPELPAEDARHIAEAIATAAVRYFMVKFSRGKVIVFDIDEALSFEGESGPYLQYAAVRANNIFNKLKERHDLDEPSVISRATEAQGNALTGPGDEADDLWNLMLEAARLDEIVDQAVRTMELSVVAKYAFSLAQAFNGFYHKYSILNEEREDVRVWRAAAVAYARRQLTRALDLMGCAVPAKM